MSQVQQLLTEHLDIWTAAETEKKSGRGNTSINSSGVYGIKKLRELILELAINGKIVHSEDIWKHTKLGDIGTWAVGSGFPTAAQGSKAGDILFAKVSDMNNPGNEKFILQTNNTITEEVAKELRVNIHPRGTVIFPKIGGAIATNKRRILIKPTAIDNNCLGLIPKNGVSTEWIFLILSAIDLSKYQAGTSVPALAQGVLQEIQVMLPNVQDQHRIVSKVDELMTLCDQLEQQHSNAAEAHEKLVEHLLGTLTHSTVRPELVEGHGSTSSPRTEFEENWQRIYAHFDTLFTTEASIDALKQTLLQLAVMGKLVPQDPTDKPSSELLKRIQAEKAKLIAEGKLKKEKPLTPIADDEKSFDLPKGWIWVRFGDALINRDAERIPISSEIRQSRRGEYDYYGASGVIDKVDEYLFDKPLLLIGEDGANLLNRSTPIAFIAQGKYWVNNHAHVLDGLTESLLRYVEIYINATNLEPYVTGTAQPKMNQAKMNSILLGLPPEPEQHRIVAKVDEMMALCDQLKTCIQKASQNQQKLADVLVAQAVA